MRKKDKTICIVSLNGIGNKGGVERVSYYLFDILKNKFNVKLIACGKFSFGKLKNFIWPLILSLKLYFIPNKFVISNSWHCFLYPSNLSIHHGTSAGIMQKTGEKNLALRITAWMEKQSARNARKVLAVSENCKEELIELYKIDAQKIFLLNNFVDETIFSCKKAGKKEGAIRVLFVGAMIEKKGLSKLKEFSDYIECSGENMTLFIASPFSYNAEMFRGNKMTEIVTSLKTEQMPDFYKSGDVLFFPTKYEGFSMATMEALSSGIPVVGTKAAVSNEIRHFDFCKVIDEDISMAELCETIKSTHRKFAGREAEIHRQIAAEFGKEAYIKKVMDFIKF